MALSLFMKRTAPKKNIVNFGIFTKKIDYKKCYTILGIDDESDHEQIRLAYLEMVKRFHPDSGTEEANAEKFAEVHNAFHILINKKSKERWEVEDEAIIVEGPDIKHTAPQHRQYLSYEGLGSGNPFQRQKQYAQVRAMKATENVYEHRVAKATADDKSLLNKSRIYESWEKVPLKHKIKTKYAYDRLVEDLIQESMSKGEFNNLKGSGKPLPYYQTQNPYVDFVTHKINEVLIDNGFTPEWISLQKEIRTEANRLRNDLLMERKYFGPYPLSIEENIEWSNKVFEYQKVVNLINKKITKFNLVVPVVNKQMLHINLENEAQKAMVKGKSCENFRCDGSSRNADNKNIEQSNTIINLFSFIDNIFKKK